MSVKPTMYVCHCLICNQYIPKYKVDQLNMNVYVTHTFWGITKVLAVLSIVENIK